MAHPTPETAPPPGDTRTAGAPERRAVVAVSLSGPEVRYAEVVHEPAADGRGGAVRLRRLGALDFAFDAERAVLGSGVEGALGDVSEGLGEVLGGTAAGVLVVAAHPTTTTTFFTPLPDGLSGEARDAQLRDEAALLADLPSALAVRVRAVPVRAEAGPGGGRQWYQVVHVAEPVHTRLSLLADDLGLPAYDLADTTRAAAALAGDGASGDGVDVVVGAYGGHTEVAVRRGGALVFAHSGSGPAAEDTAYFALAALQHAGLDASAAGRLLTYGTAADPGRLGLVAELLGCAPEPLDPFAAFARRPDVSAAERAAFAPVLGAAL